MTIFRETQHPIDMWITARPDRIHPEFPGQKVLQISVKQNGLTCSVLLYREDYNVNGSQIRGLVRHMQCFLQEIITTKRTGEKP